jgi:osomolarity two-component system response regulator SSK1
MRSGFLTHCHTSVNTPKTYFLSSSSTQIVRQILATAHFGDSVQVGLYLVAPIAVSPEAGDSPVFEVPLDATEPADTTSLPDPDLPLRCTFHITHTFVQHLVGASQPPGTSTTRTKPSVDSPILHRLVHHTKASFTHELTDTAFACKLSMTLERGSPAVVNPAIVFSDNDPILQAFPDFKLSGEPTLEDLSQFVGTLKGKRVSLYANATGIFAQHLTSYLASWGLDVSHVSPDPEAEGSPVREAATPPSVEYTSTLGETFSGGPILQTLPEQELPPAPLTAKAQNQSPSFILIDDDISVLRERLRKLRAEISQPFQLPRKRPNLAANHRPRSSPQVTRAIGHSSPAPSARSAAVILHFTSLANFKLVKAVLQSVLGPGSGTPSRLPEVIVIPKPAGPRRVLTALHTAATKPIVDPFFSPIATSPMSPGLYPTASYFPQNASPKSPMTRPSSSPRGFSYQSLRSPRATVELSDTSGLPPSPLGLSEGMDYFSEAAVKLGSSPSSGLVIQSPNGQPAGIFFHPPRSRSSRSSSQQSESGQVSSRGNRRHSDAPDWTRQAGGATFLNLPGPMQQRRLSPTQVRLDSVRSGASTPLPSGSGDDAPVISPTSHTGTSASVRQRASTVEALRKTTSPPPPRTSPTSAIVPPKRRGLGPRRSQFENTSSSSSPMRKVKASEPSIVPPISVLIVEGLCCLRISATKAEGLADNPINQTLLSTFMRKKKIKYDVAKNGEEAVEKWRSGGFHLILVGSALHPNCTFSRMNSLW